MTIEEALKILELNVICSPRATQFKEAVEVITKELKYQNEVIEKKQTEYDIVRKSAIRWMNKCKKLQAEIERLSDKNRKCIYLSDVETTEHCVDAICPKFKTEKQIKSEAIKEHNEKVKNALISKGFHSTAVKEALEEIKEEMGGN